MKGIVIPGFSGGFTKGRASDRLLEDSPNMQNFWVVDGVAQKRTGYAAFAGANFAGNFLHGVHYQDSLSGTRRFVGLTSSKALIKETLAGDWTDKTNAMAIQSGDDQYFTTTEIVDFSDYKTYLIACQNHTYPITALNGTRGGSESVVWYMDSPTSNLAKLGGALGYNDASGDDYHRCKQAIEFGDHLLLLNTYECIAANTWANLFFRVRYSGTAEFNAADNWNPTADGSTAGYKDLRCGGGAILRGEILRDTLYIYMQKALVSFMKTNIATNPFYPEIRVQGLGLYGCRYLCATRNAHYFIGSDKQFYAYAGGPTPVEIGDDIRSEVFANINKNGTGNYLYRDRGFAFPLTDEQGVGFAIPTTTNYPDTIYAYFPRKQKWYKWVLAANLTGWGEWLSAVGTVANTLPIFGSTAGVAYQFDYSSANDVSTAIDAYIETGDFIVDVKHKQRTMGVYFEASGDGAASSVSVYASNDGGATWGTAQTKTVSTGWEAYQVQFHSISDYTWRLKFRNNTAGQKLKIRRVYIEMEEGPKIP